MSEIFEKTISNLVENQFPNLYKEEGIVLVEFVKKYYEWLETTNNAIYYTRTLPDLRDIDTTTEEFLVYFKEKYLKNIQFDTNTNIRQLVKHSLDLYRAKGTERAIDLLFRLVFGTNAEVYYPAEDVFRTSVGKWVKPTYLEVSINEESVKFVNKQIVGLTSGATAFCSRVVRRTISGRLLDVIYITNISGKFITGEKINTSDKMLDTSVCPVITGSLNYIEVSTDGTGSLFSIGEIVNVTSPYGKQAKGRVTNVSDVQGIVNFTLENGGYGFSSNSVVLISEKVLSLGNVQIAANNNSSHYFELFETISQPKIKFNYTSANGSFTVGANVFTYHANNLLKGSGIVSNVSTINSTAGELTIIPSTGNLNSSNIYTTGNSIVAVQAVSNGYNNDTMTANLMAISSNVILSVTNYSSSFEDGEEIYQLNPITNFVAANGIFRKIENLAGANVDILISGASGVFKQGLNIYGANSNSHANVVSSTITVGVINVVGSVSTSPYNYVNGSVGFNTGKVLTVSQGSGANIGISNDLIYSENITYNTDLLKDYTNVQLNATQYLLPGAPSGNLTFKTLGEQLTFANVQIGKINALTGVAKGSGYSVAPFVRIYSPYVYGFRYQDYKLLITGSTGQFTVGELITQASNGARGIVKFANSTVVLAERLNFKSANTIIPTVNSTTTIVGESSGVTANVTTVYTDYASNTMGFNAVINTSVQTEAGSITGIDVIDSGFGYIQGDILTIESNNNIGTAFARIETHGTAEGFYETKGGFLSDQKKLFDGKYYQDYSYEVRSSISLDKYKDMLKQILHVAGTQYFGQFIYNTTIDANVNILSANITIEAI